MLAGLKDSFLAPRGHFLLKVYRGSELVDVVDKPNLIVDGSKQIHAKLLGGTFTNNNVTTIGFGTNGAAPAGGNTSLTGAYTKALDSVTFPASNQVAFNFSLAAIENNGMAILEFGLLTGASALYARVVRSSALNKASDISIAGSWTISF